MRTLRSSPYNVRTGETVFMKELEHLIEQAKWQNADAFTELMQLRMKDMYRVAFAILMNDEDVADAIQETILTCWEKLPSLKHTAYFQTWQTRILINHCYDIRRKRAPLTGLEEWDEPSAWDRYNVEWKEALAGVGEAYRVVLILYYSEGYRIREIAELLKRPVGTIKTQLARGREQMAHYYKDELNSGEGSRSNEGKRADLI